MFGAVTKLNPLNCPNQASYSVSLGSRSHSRSRSHPISRSLLFQLPQLLDHSKQKVKLLLSARGRQYATHYYTAISSIVTLYIHFHTFSCNVYGLDPVHSVPELPNMEGTSQRTFQKLKWYCVLQNSVRVEAHSPVTSSSTHSAPMQQPYPAFILLQTRDLGCVIKQCDLLYGNLHVCVCELRTSECGGS